MHSDPMWAKLGIGRRDKSIGFCSVWVTGATEAMAEN